jgi:hypothetical protein
MNIDKREMLTGEVSKTEKVLPWDLSQSFSIWSIFDSLQHMINTFLA